MYNLLKFPCMACIIIKIYLNPTATSYYILSYLHQIVDTIFTIVNNEIKLF